MRLSDAALATTQAATAALIVLERAPPKAKARIHWGIEATAATAVGERRRCAIEAWRTRTTATTGRTTRFRFVHANRTSAEVLSVEAANRFGRLGVGRELDERKAARATGLAIGYDARSHDRPDGFERFEQFLVCEAETQIADKD